MTESEVLAPSQGFRSGFVALVGRPNVGKSTLLNALVGEQVAIATYRPQTTRDKIRGIVHRPSCQIVFVDTPGIHDKDRAINRYMLEEARSAIGEVDLVVLLVEARGRGRRPDEDDEDRLVLEAVSKGGRPALLAVNKIDKLKDKTQLFGVLEAYGETGLFEEMVPISALKKDGIESLLQAIEQRLPEGPAFFPEEMYTDQPERLLVGELIREQLFLQVGQEVPYSVAVEVEAFVEDPKSKRVVIHAVIYIERKSQKGIIIGKGGKMLRSIGSEARRAIEKLLDCKVFLDLHVKVADNWSQSLAGLNRVGYRKG